MNTTNFFNSSKMMNRLFRKVDNICWDLTTGNLGIFTSEGIVTCSGQGDEAEITINPLEQMGMAVPAFAQNTPSESVKLGDIIYSSAENSKLCGWVVEQKGKSFMVLKPDGTRVNWSAPKVPLLGIGSGVMVLRSLINSLPNGKDGLSNITGMMMQMQMMSAFTGNDMDMESLMPMLLMSQMGSTIQGEDDAVTNPFGALNMTSLMPMMMQMQMMKAFSGNNKRTGSKNGFGGTNFFDNNN